MKLNELRENWKKTLLDARAITDKAEAEGRELTAEEKQNCERLVTEAGDLKTQIKAAEDEAAFVKSIADMTAGLDLGGGVTKSGIAVPSRKRLMSRQVLEADEFRSWLKSVAPHGRVLEGARLQNSMPLGVDGLMAWAGYGEKTLVTADSDTSAGAFIQTDYTGIYEPLGRYALTVRDLIQVRTTESDLVHFVRQTARVTQAAVTAEANVTTYSGASGEVEGEKPEGALAFVGVTAEVKTIPVWIPITKQALSDASQMRGIIDQELRADVQEELEDQILNGDGSGANFTGIFNTASTLTQAWDTDIPTTVRKAKTTLQTTGRSRPTAILMNPEDFESVDLLQDKDGRYIYGGPEREGMRVMWGVPVVESEAVTQGTALMGDFRKAVVWDRQQATITMSDSHNDFFIRNMVAILCELRAAFGVIRPSAFIEIAMESGS